MNICLSGNRTDGLCIKNKHQCRVVKRVSATGREGALPLSERRRVHIVNPASGAFSGRRGAEKLRSVTETAERAGDEVIKSQHSGHIEELVGEVCVRDPFAHLIVYGGDGTVGETVNGIMNAGVGGTASFSAAPMGSGNDFAKYANDASHFAPNVLHPIDVIRVSCGDNTRYFVNMMNVGFDCNVVKETYTLKKKPLLHGSAAYIAGVVKVLARKKTFRARLLLEGVETVGDNKKSTSETFETDVLLTAAANSCYCGGGFRAAPLALPNDGLMDVLIVKSISRLCFVSLVRDYHDGTYISGDGVMDDRFNKILTYRRCRRLTLCGAETYCVDGEVCDVMEDSPIIAEVVPHGLLFAPLL